MREQCKQQARTALANQQERAKPRVPRYLHPCSKGPRPFYEWSIDHMVGLFPPGLLGETAVIMAIDVFTKFPEASATREVSSSSAAAFLHTSIVCRYGLPATVRVDRGTEFDGAFREYCCSAGIRIRRINTCWPRAQG